jgi:hypothetical protein
MQYTAEGKFATEEEAKTDLDTCGYAGKWASAKRGLASERPHLSGPAYWDAVRLYFLELGGCWLSQRTTPAPAAPLTPLQQRMAVQAAAIAASRQSYTPPQKVRFA